MLILNCIDITTIDNDTYHFFKDEVSKKRSDLATQFVFPDDAKRCVLSELLLQYSFLRTKKTFENVEVKCNAYGKPSLRNEENFSYNLSHSGKWVVIAYGEMRTEIGLDIEHICLEEKDLPVHAFTDKEQDYINMASSEVGRIKNFIQMWTLKESYVKYIGTGLSTDLDSFSILMEEPIKIQNRYGIHENVHFKNYLFQNDYYLSVCSHEEKIVIQEVKVEDLMDFLHKKKQFNTNSFEKEQVSNRAPWREI